MQTPAEQPDQGTSAQGSSNTSQTAANTGAVPPKGILKRSSQVSTDQNVYSELEEAVSRPKKRVRIAEEDNQLRPYDPYGPPSSSHIFFPSSATTQGKVEERSDSTCSTSSDSSSPPRKMGNTASKIPLFAPKSPSGSPEPDETQQTLSTSREDTPFSPAKPAVQVPFYERQPKTPISRTYGKSSKPSSSEASSKTLSAGPSPRKVTEKGKQREEEADTEVPAKPPSTPGRIRPVPTVAAKAAAREAATTGGSTSSSKVPFPVVEHASGSPELPEPPRKTPASSRPRAVSKPEVAPSAKSGSSKKPLSLDSSTPAKKRKFDDTTKPKSEGKRSPFFSPRKNAASTKSSAKTPPVPTLRTPARSARGSAPSSSDKAERSKYREDSISSSDEFEEHSTSSRASKKRRKTGSEDDGEYKPPSSSSLKNTPKKSIRTRRDSQHEDAKEEEAPIREKSERKKLISAGSTPRKAKKSSAGEDSEGSPGAALGESAKKATKQALSRTVSSEDFVSNTKFGLRASTLIPSQSGQKESTKPAPNHIYAAQSASGSRGKSVEPTSSKTPPSSSSKKPKSADSFMSKPSFSSTPAKKRRIVEDESDSDAFEVTPTKAIPSAPASRTGKDDAASIATSTALQDDRMEHVQSSIAASAAANPVVAPRSTSGGKEAVLPPQETVTALDSSSGTLPGERDEKEQPMRDIQADIIENSAKSFEDDDIDLDDEAMPAVEEAMAMTEALPSSEVVEATESRGEERMEAEEDLSSAAQAMPDGTTAELADQAMQDTTTIAEDQSENSLADRAMPFINDLSVSVDVSSYLEPALKVADMTEILAAEDNEETSPDIAKRTLHNEGDMAEYLVSASVHAAKLQEVEKTVQHDATVAELGTEEDEATLIDPFSDALLQNNDIRASASGPAYEWLPAFGPVRTPHRQLSNSRPYPAVAEKPSRAVEDVRDSSVAAKPVSTGEQSGYEASISSKRLESAEPVEGNEAMVKQYNMPKQIDPDAEDVLHGKDSSASPDKKPDLKLLRREILSKSQRQHKAEDWMQKQSNLDASDYVDPADGTRSRRPSSSAALTSYGSDMSAVPDSEISEADHIDNSRFDVLQNAIDHRLSGKPLQAEDAQAAMQDVETVIPVADEEHASPAIPSDSLTVAATAPHSADIAEEPQVQSPAFTHEPSSTTLYPVEMQRSSPDRVLQPTFIVATNDGTSNITCPSCSHLDELRAFGICYVEPGPAVLMPASRRGTATSAKEEAFEEAHLPAEKALPTAVDSEPSPEIAASVRVTGNDGQGVATEEPAPAADHAESGPDLSIAVKSESSEVKEGVAHRTAKDSMDVQGDQSGSLFTAASTTSEKVADLTFANTGPGVSTRFSNSTLTARRKQNLDNRRNLALQFNKSAKRRIRQSPQLPNQGSGSNLSLDSNVSLDLQSEKPDSSSRRSAKRVFNEMEAWNTDTSSSADPATYEVKQIELPSSPKPKRKQATLPKRGQQEKSQSSKGSSRKSATMPAIPESPMDVVDENRGQGAAAAVQRIAASTSRRTAVAKLLPFDQAPTVRKKNRLEPSQRMKPAFLAAVINQDKPKDISESSSNVSEDQIVERAIAPVSTSKSSRRSIPQESQ